LAHPNVKKLINKPPTGFLETGKILIMKLTKAQRLFTPKGNYNVSK